MRVVSVIPARAGSKGILRKNIQLLAGIPLIEHTIRQSVNCNLISRTIVSSDDDVVCDIASKFECLVHQRNVFLAQDDTAMIHVLKNVITDYELHSSYDAIILLQPTSPIRGGGIIEKCILDFINGAFNSLVTVSESDPTFLKSLVEIDKKLLPVNDEKYLFYRRQDLPKVYKIDGNVFIFNIKSLMNSDNLLIHPFQFVKNFDSNGLDIDTFEDILVAEKILSI